MFHNGFLFNSLQSKLLAYVDKKSQIMILYYNLFSLFGSIYFFFFSSFVFHFFTQYKTNPLFPQHSICLHLFFSVLNSHHNLEVFDFLTTTYFLPYLSLFSSNITISFSAFSFKPNTSISSFEVDVH